MDGFHMHILFYLFTVRLTSLTLKYLIGCIAGTSGTEAIRIINFFVCRQAETESKHPPSPETQVAKKFA